MPPPKRGASALPLQGKVKISVSTDVPPLSQGIVLFDGTCAFCARAVTFIARRDPAAYFRFGASQTDAAARLLASHGVARESARSIILIENGQVFLRSTASLRIARRLTWPWSTAGALLRVPVPVRDAVYRAVAAVRHRLAGSTDVCAVPPPAIRARMLDG
jgi:predicted DCC family thiol-disulfide oxidoreductase YuxK